MNLEFRWLHRRVTVDSLLSESDKREFCEHFMDPEPAMSETVLQYRIASGSWRDVPHEIERE